ncbi:maltose-binding protein /trehalose-binding protein /sucrose-binding protein [Lentzea waywayandensis]|uniref:Maltose-binding protein /trehalose-binding protein /sucrose-binding protein n=1 Tax=Lentzea waywayandensis TaxID=84724 RepID=A0A1I6FJW4_9PSEU|nr:ABC transporter substrate-binding protein [Lentzea waywayandensis]SFR30178.1 maltose-binding protein /trehalose-binding protein /sucrose-binding protein [Lentzea waywayandensis]
MRFRAIVSGLALIFATAACDQVSMSGEDTLRNQTVDVIGSWEGLEETRFEKVLDAYTAKTGVKVRYTGAGADLPALVQTRIAGGVPPGVALVPQPGLAAQLAKSGAIKPVSAAVEQTVARNYAPVWRKLGSVGGTLYGVYFKVSHKSTVWYSRRAFEVVSPAIEPPRTWQHLLSVSQALVAKGKPALSIAGADAWTLTDWFENVYLRVAGSENYDKLANHEIPWTDPTVRTALEELAELFGVQGVVEGGTASALRTDFATSVANVFGDPAKAAMVFEGDFVAGVIDSTTNAFVGGDAALFPFPSINGGAPAVVAGGDMAVQFKDDKATNELMNFLASPESGAVWAGEGGFVSANKNIKANAYADDITRELVRQIIDIGDGIRFDLSDFAPPAFGGTKGAGMLKHMQDFLADPTKIENIVQRLEFDAVRAYAR